MDSEPVFTLADLVATIANALRRRAVGLCLDRGGGRFTLQDYRDAYYEVQEQAFQCPVRKKLLLRKAAMHLRDMPDLVRRAGPDTYTWEAVPPSPLKNARMP